MTIISQALKIKIVAEDIYAAMTEKELYDFVIWQITASLEQLPENDVNDMYDEVIAENAE